MTLFRNPRHFARTFSAILALVLVGAFLPTEASFANPAAESVPDIVKQTPDVEARYALQISNEAPIKRKMVLKVAQNLLKQYGPHKVDIEIVAFGPGLQLLFKDNNPFAKMIAKLAEKGVRFSACHNSIKHETKVLGHPPVLLPEARVVPSGAFRLHNLFAAGYFVLKP